jgi:hypothetical protein
MYKALEYLLTGLHVIVDTSGQLIISMMVPDNDGYITLMMTKNKTYQISKVLVNKLLNLSNGVNGSH